MTDAYQHLTAIALAVVYGYIVYTDFSRLKIANGAVLAIAVVAGAASLVEGLGHFGADLLVGGILFAVTFPFWLLGAIGAGDVKLIAVSGLAVGPADVFTFAALVLVSSLLIVVLVSYAKYLNFLPVAFSLRLTTFLNGGRIPYGIPIALAAIATVGLRIFTLA